MNKTLLYSLFVLSFLTSCKKEIKSKSGGIDIISNMYINASKGLDDIHSFHISKINYSNDTIIELVPMIENPSIAENIYFIKDSILYDMGRYENASISGIAGIVSMEKPISVYDERKTGAIFTKERIPNYIHHRVLKDTILFGKTYSRFEINSPQSYSRYYVYKTDTILPYSLYRHAEIDHKGRIERIDTYNKEKDIFITLQLIPRTKLDEEAKDILSFNKFLQKKAKE